MPKRSTSHTDKLLALFIPIQKIDEEQRLVYGEVASEVPDNAGETFDYEGSKSYFQKWSDNAHSTSGGKSYGNVRVMHTSKVAGKVSSPLGFDDENKVISACAKIVDDEEWKKVQTGCYTGFSMGGRYVQRINKGSEKRYIADPIEISLVDKPCIPTATFEVIKADGISEERHFHEDLYQDVQKSDNTGEETMYVPTNDEILPVAQALAKAAGKTDADWLEFVEPARADLIAKHDASNGSGDLAKTDHDKDAEKGEAFEKEGDDADKKDGEDESEKGDVEEDVKKEDDPEDKESDEGGEKDASEEDADKKDEEEDASKSDVPELQQGWKAKDGTFFLKKADALAHNETIAKADDEPSLADQLRSLAADAEKIAKGEIEEPKEDEPKAITKAVVDSEITEPVAKLLAFFGNDLAKGMYEVKELACIITALECLHSMVSCEAAWEGDGSTIPSVLLEHLKGLGDALVLMAKEEVTELLARASKDTAEVAAVVADDAIVELASSTLGLEKSALADTLQKRAEVTPPSDVLVKLADANKAAADAVAKADKLEGEINEIAPLVKSLQAQLEEIKKLPMGKAPTTSLSKGEDVRGGSPMTSEELLKKYTPEQLSDAAIRYAQSHGRQVVLPNSGQ